MAQVDVGRLLNQLRGSRHPGRRLSSLKPSLTPSQSLQLLATLNERTFFRQALLPDPFPEEPQKLSEADPLNIAPLATELAWAVAWCLQHSGRLQDAVTKRYRIAVASYAGDWSAAEQLSRDFGRTFGASLWLIAQRIRIGQGRASLDGNKACANFIKAQMSARSFVSFITHYLSVRNEPAVSLGRLATDVMFALKAGVSPQTSLFIQHQLLPHLVVSDAALAASLQHASVLSAVDAYEAAVITCLLVLAQPDHKDRPTVVKLATMMATAFSDGRLLVALRNISRPVSSSQGTSEYKPGHLGEIDFLIRSVRGLPLVTGEVGHPSLAILAAEAVQGNPTSSDALADLIKKSVNDFGSTLSLACLSIAASEISLSEGPVSDRYSGIGALLSEGPSALWIGPASADTASSDRRSSFVGAVGSAEAMARILVRGRRALFSSAWGDALICAQALAAQPSPYYQRWAVMLKADALLGLGKVLDCAEFVTTTVIRAPHWHSSLPLRTCAERISEIPEAERRRSLSIPVLCEILRRYGIEKTDSKVYYAYEDYLSAHGVERPSQLKFSTLSPADLLLLPHFFRHVCVEGVMDQSISFESSRAVAEERLAVCRLLTHLDPDQLSVYHNEIKEISRALTLRKRLREVEQSRIFVDIESLKRSLSTGVQEAFNRYVALVRETPARKNASGLADRIDLSLARRVGLDIPRDETEELLLTMVETVRNEFALSADHGLDKYLSVRIRHGTFAAHMRRPLERTKLITKRDLQKGFHRNEAWLYLAGDSQESQAWIAYRFLEFAQDFHNLIDRMLSQLQVAVSEGEPGMFGFSLAPGMVERLSERAIAESFTFDQFVDEAITTLNAVLDESLDSVRTVLSGNFKSTATAMLERLAKDFEETALDGDMSSVVNTIRMAKGDLAYEIDRISEWFRRSTGVGPSPFHFEEAIEIGVEGMKVLEPTFHVEAIREGSGRVNLSGRFLFPMLDVFFVLFENIVRHAGLGGVPRAIIRYRVERRRSLVVRVENAIGASTNLDEVKDRVRRIQSAIGEGPRAESIRREGGTGLLKVHSILAHEFGLNCPFAFGCEGSTFYVEFGIGVNHEDPTN